jgi:hypothetical protein
VDKNYVNPVMTKNQCFEFDSELPHGTVSNLAYRTGKRSLLHSEYFPWSWPQAAEISLPLLVRTIAVSPPSIKIS